MDKVLNSPSWGAFVFNWLYLAYMRAYRHFAVALTASVLSYVLTTVSDSAFSLTLAGVLGLTPWLYYTFVGKSIAWRTRRWDDFEDFLACQRKWDSWAKWIFGITASVIVLVWLIAASGIVAFGLLSIVLAGLVQRR